MTAPDSACLTNGCTCGEDDPTAAQITAARADYAANAFGYDGPADYAATQYPTRTAAFHAALAEAIR